LYCIENKTKEYFIGLLSNQHIRNLPEKEKIIKKHQRRLSPNTFLENEFLGVCPFNNINFLKSAQLCDFFLPKFRGPEASLHHRKNSGP
jgi:hypothetical protein